MDDGGGAAGDIGFNRYTVLNLHALLADNLLAALPGAEQAHFVEVVHDQLMGLHEGNMARYRLRPSEIAAWQVAWRQMV